MPLPSQGDDDSTMSPDSKSAASTRPLRSPSHSAYSSTYSVASPRLKHPKSTLARLHTQPQPPLSPMPTAASSAVLPSAPASPPTPAPSPTPTRRAPEWTVPHAKPLEGPATAQVVAMFAGMDEEARQNLLMSLLSLCDTQQLSFVQEFVSPRLKRDPFAILPVELCLRVRNPHPRVVGLAAQKRTCGPRCVLLLR